MGMFSRMKLSNTGFIIVGVMSLLLVLHFSSKHSEKGCNRSGGLSWTQDNSWSAHSDHQPLPRGNLICVCRGTSLIHRLQKDAVLVFILQSAEFCYLSINENMHFLVKLRWGSKNKPYKQCGWKSETWEEMLLHTTVFSALGYEGISAAVPREKRCHSLIPSPKAPNAKIND